MMLRLSIHLHEAAHRFLAAPGDPPPGQGGSVKAPDPAPSAPPGLEDKISTLVAWGKWAVLVCGVAGLLICGGQMAIGRKNRSSFAADGATGIPWVLGGLSLAATAASIVDFFFA